MNVICQNEISKCNLIQKDFGKEFVSDFDGYGEKNQNNFDHTT